MARILSFSLDNETAHLLDKIERKIEFRNRSELIRSALQLLLREIDNLDELKGHIGAILVVVHNQKQEEIISKLKHQFSDVIITQIHNNLHGQCLELFLLNGRSELIIEFFKQLKKSKSVEYAKLIQTHV